MLGLFEKKEFRCFNCGTLTTEGANHSVYGGICKDCLEKLKQHEIGENDINSLTNSQIGILCEERILPEEVINYFGNNGSPIRLKDDEKCYYTCSACGAKVKNVTTGYSGKRNGVSFKIISGVYYHAGSSGGKAIREDILDTSAVGTFVMTNKRLILQTQKYGFELTGDKIDNVEFLNDGFTIYAKGKPYNVVTSEAKIIRVIMQLMINAYSELEEQKKLNENIEETPKKKKASKKSVPIADELRAYKDLVDEGVITQEEFDAKKKQLLGI